MIWTPSNLQTIFRYLQTAFSRPGTLMELVPQSKEPAMLYHVLACLVDHQVSIHDAFGQLAPAFLQLLACREAPIDAADFVVARGATCPASARYKSGSLSHPEMTSTLVLDVENFNQADGLPIRLSGPGILGSTQINVSGLSRDWLVLRNRQCATFPLGNDYIFCSERAIVALPRSTKVEFDSL